MAAALSDELEDSNVLMISQSCTACERPKRKTWEAGPGASNISTAMVDDDLWGPPPGNQSSEFGAAEGLTAPHVVIIAPRGDAHPHFLRGHALWPPASALLMRKPEEQLTALKTAAGALKERFSSAGSLCVAGLSASKAEYGRACARLLRETGTLFVLDGHSCERAMDKAARVVDLCAAQLEEGDWSDPNWQTANLLGLAVQLACSLYQHLHRPNHMQGLKDVKCETAFLTSASTKPAIGPPSSDDDSSLGPEMTRLGRLALALFNLSVSSVLAAADVGIADEEDTQWISSLLTLAEACFLHKQFSLPPPPPLSDASAWELPRSAGFTKPVLNGTQIKTAGVASMSAARFFSEHLRRAEPVVIQGHLEEEQWEALSYFSDLRSFRDSSRADKRTAICALYERRLHREHGSRLVPVTRGSPLVDYGGVSYVPLSQFVRNYLLPSNAAHKAPVRAEAEADDNTRCAVAYMSQHHLFHQIPELQRLIAIPRFTIGRTLSPLNAWLGTCGTVTSLHSDPGDNLLCQVAGYKYVRLYSLDQTKFLYARTLLEKSTNSFGTSPVRVEAPDLEKYPEFAKATYTEAVLAPGDVLFIPKRHWHYVRSLTTSFSVNIWF